MNLIESVNTTNFWNIKDVVYITKKPFLYVYVAIHDTALAASQ